MKILRTKSLEPCGSQALTCTLNLAPKVGLCICDRIAVLAETEKTTGKARVQVADQVLGERALVQISQRCCAVEGHHPMWSKYRFDKEICGCSQTNFPSHKASATEIRVGALLA
jgi:hypothetical protein